MPVVSRVAGKNPEVPGYCVREKDLETCESSADCKGGSRCTPLGRRKMLYCIHEDDIPKQQEAHMGRYPQGKKGGLCEYTQLFDSFCEVTLFTGFHWVISRNNVTELRYFA